MRLVLIALTILGLAACEAPVGGPGSSFSPERTPRDVDDPHRGA